MESPDNSLEQLLGDSPTLRTASPRVSDQEDYFTLDNPDPGGDGLLEAFITPPRAKKRRLCEDSLELQQEFQ